MFRAPERRPPAVLSAAFALLVLAPLGLLVAMLRSLGVNLRVRFRFRATMEPSISRIIRAQGTHDLAAGELLG